MFIDVYQSQDSTNQTLWIFSGTGTARELYSVRNSSSGNANRHRRDTWEVDDNGGDLYVDPEPSSLHIVLSPLLSSSNAKDIASLNARIPGGGKTNITFAASATNTPTITFTTGNNASRNRTISHLFMNGVGQSALFYRDDIGVRVSGGSFRYENNDASAWRGAGILAKPISDFEMGTFNNQEGLAATGPAFAANSRGSTLIRFHHGTIIPEPQEYALVFGLFALAFVLFHRWRMQKKHRQQQQATTS